MHTNKIYGAKVKTAKFSSKKLIMISVLVFMAICISQTLNANPDTFYRYKNADGQITINSTIPPEYVKNGYEIVSSSGIVTKVVPPQKTKAEIIQMRAERKALAAAKAEEALIRKLFQSEKDIDTQFLSKHNAVAAQIEIAERLIFRLQSRKSGYLHKAADLEKSGMAIPVSVIDNIKDIDDQIEDQIAFIAEKNKEQKAIDLEKQKTITKFRQFNKSRRN